MDKTISLTKRLQLSQKWYYILSTVCSVFLCFSMKQELDRLFAEATSEISQISTLLELEALDTKYLGRKQGELTNLLKGLKDLSAEEKSTIGPEANRIKTALEAALADKKSALSAAALQSQLEHERIDITEPPLPATKLGHLHPSTHLERDIEAFFTGLGFITLDGPELESDYYNFTAVNVPEHHPARDMQDTFYIKNHPTWVMRTHTSSVQVRALQTYGAPLRAIIPGRCFRNEATDARHEHTFMQLEGIMVDTGITFAHLKGTLTALAEHLFGEGTRVRLRPKFYPFVEPGVNGEVTCFLCHGTGCRVCKKSGWLEILGAGMIHPNVLKEGGIDTDIYSGFAFGIGFTRLVMLKYGIQDVRDLLKGDVRMIKEF